MGDFPKIQDAWVWPHRVERWFRDRMEGYTLHVCCGTSNLGDVTVDIDPDNDPDVVADMNDLPFDPCTFDTVIWDPPWKVPIFERHGPYYELLETVRANGTVLTNTLWIPESSQTQVVDCAVRQDYERGNISLLAELRRFPGQQTWDEVEA